MLNKVAVVVAFFFGKRDRALSDNSLEVVDLQIENLSYMNNDNVDYYFVVNGPEVLDIHAPNITVINRDNLGGSYGAWSHFGNTLSHQYDYVIWCEDDYIFCQPDFVTMLINKFHTCPNAGILCGFAHETTRWKMHCAISCGITASYIIKENGNMPFTHTVTKTYCDLHNILFDWSDQYYTIFYDGEYRQYGSGPPLLCALHYVKKYYASLSNFYQNIHNLNLKEVAKYERNTSF